MTRTLAHTTKRLFRWWLAPVIGLLAIGGIESHAAPQAAGADVPATGLVCTTSANGVFTLRAGTGQISTPDDNLVFMWGYSEQGHPFQYPGRTCA